MFNGSICLILLIIMINNNTVYSTYHFGVPQQFLVFQQSEDAL